MRMSELLHDLWVRHTPLSIHCRSLFFVQMEVKDVWYSYATRKKTPALRGVSLTMEPGKLLALVGLSGSGKSTLVALLERLYDPDEGQVRGPLCKY